MSLLSKPRAIQYSTVMTDLLTRWRALDVAGRQAAWQRSCRLFAGPMTRVIDSHLTSAVRAADGLWKRDPSVWSQDAAVQQKIANRLGWLDSPLLMAESGDRLRAFADGGT